MSTKINGRPVNLDGTPANIPLGVPFCSLMYKGKQYTFFAVDDKYCESPLTGELLLRHQAYRYYLTHVRKTLKQFPQLAK